MTDLAPNLERLELEQYLDALVGEGFDTWETLLDIQESDFDALNVKLGHRRKLQRAIADYRGISYERLVGSPAQESVQEGPRHYDGTSAAATSTERGPGPATEKRKYRRHPKPDDNAPERPPSAYVIFSNKIREEIKDQNLSFSQIAKLVGERWQKLSGEEKEPFEGQANAAKERYNIQLSAYRKTDRYKEYMQYLSEFKAKHGGQTSDQPKRPKLDAESSGSIISAKSLELNPDMTSQTSGHGRGGSMSSAASNSLVGGHSQAGIAPSRPPLPSSRSGSPPSAHHNREPFRPGLISSQSSVSDESSTLRSDMPESLMRTAGLSIGAGLSGTPPLQPQPPSASPRESVPSPDSFGRSRTTFPYQQQQSSTQTGANTAYQPPYQHNASSPIAQEPMWRNRPSDFRGYQDSARVQPISSPFVQVQPQITANHLPPMMSSDNRGFDANPAQTFRTLPPPRGISTLPHPGRAMDPPRPMTTGEFQNRNPAYEGVRSALDRSESDAANALAGLASGVSRSETAKPKNHPPSAPPY